MFPFVLQLMDTNAQLWYIIREYISNSEVALTFLLNNIFAICVVCALVHPHLVQERGVDAAELISFMLELSFHVIGEVRHYCSLMRVFLHKKTYTMVFHII